MEEKHQICYLNLLRGKYYICFSTFKDVILSYKKDGKQESEMKIFAHVEEESLWKRNSKVKRKLRIFTDQLPHLFAENEAKNGAMTNCQAHIYAYLVILVNNSYM